MPHKKHILWSIILVDDWGSFSVVTPKIKKNIYSGVLLYALRTDKLNSYGLYITISVAVIMSIKYGQDRITSNFAIVKLSGRCIATFLLASICQYFTKPVASAGFATPGTNAETKTS
jgi:hypothetical protein